MGAAHPLELSFCSLPRSTHADDGVEHSGTLWGDSRSLQSWLLGPTLSKGATLHPCRTPLHFTDW